MLFNYRCFSTVSELSKNDGAWGMHFVVFSQLLSFISPHFFEIWDKQAIRLFFFPKEAPPPSSTANICLQSHFSAPPPPLFKSEGVAFF